MAIELLPFIKVEFPFIKVELSVDFSLEISRLRVGNSALLKRRVNTMTQRIRIYKSLHQQSVWHIYVDTRGFEGEVMNLAFTFVFGSVFGTVFGLMLMVAK